MKFAYNLALIKSEYENSYDFLDAKSVEKLKTLSEKFDGWQVGIITSDPGLAKATGLNFLEISINLQQVYCLNRL